MFSVFYTELVVPFRYGTSINTNYNSKLTES